MGSPWQLRSVCFSLLILLTIQLCTPTESKTAKRHSTSANSLRRVRQTHKNLTAEPAEKIVPIEEVEEGFKIEPSNAVKEKNLHTLFAELGPEFQKGWLRKDGKFYRPEKKGLLFFILRTPMKKKVAFCEGYLAAMDYLKKKKKGSAGSALGNYGKPDKSESDLSSVFGNGYFEAGSDEEYGSILSSNESGSADIGGGGYSGSLESGSESYDSEASDGIKQVPYYPPLYQPPPNAGDPGYPYQPPPNAGDPNYPYQPPPNAGGPNYPYQPPPNAGDPNYPYQPPPNAGDPNYPYQPPPNAGDPNYPYQPPPNAADPGYPYPPYPYPNQYPYPYPNAPYPGQYPNPYVPPPNQYPDQQPYSPNNNVQPWNNGYGQDPGLYQQQPQGYWMNNGPMYRAYTIKNNGGKKGDGDEVFPISLDEYCEHLVSMA